MNLCGRMYNHLCFYLVLCSISHRPTRSFIHLHKKDYYHLRRSKALTFHCVGGVPHRRVTHADKTHRVRPKYVYRCFHCSPFIGCLQAKCIFAWNTLVSCKYLAVGLSPAKPVSRLESCSWVTNSRGRAWVIKFRIRFAVYGAFVSRWS